MSKVMGSRQAAAVKEAEQAAEQAAKPASQIYRERMEAGVGAAVEKGKSFSSSEAAQGFKNTLSVLVQQKRITGKQASDLLAQVSIDKSANPKVRAGFAENMDNAIRTWGKPGEVGSKEGAAVIPQKISADVRGALRQAYNQYTESIGLGKIESQYRQTYRQEMMAEAKDKLPAVLSGKVKPAEGEKFIESVMKDPAGADFLRKTLTTHLANTPAEEVPKEFLKQQKMLARTGVVDTGAMADLRRSAEDIGRVVDKGVQQRAFERFKRMLVTNAIRTTAARAGEAWGED